MINMLVVWLQVWMGNKSLGSKKESFGKQLSTCSHDQLTTPKT